MKIRLTIDIDVGELMDGWREEEIRQNLYDEIINYIHIKHAEDLAEIIFRASPTQMYTVEGYKIEQASKKHCEMWSKITYRPDWKFKKL